MATLNLFPARVQFVDASGRLTPEAYRALQDLFNRVGGHLGDQGTDTFAIFAPAQDAGQGAAADMLTQPGSAPAYEAPMDMQGQSATLYGLEVWQS